MKSIMTSMTIANFLTGLALTGFAVTGFVATADAQTFVPNKGQTPEQVQKDQSECAAIANQNAAPAPAETQSGGRAKGAAKAAVVGGAMGQNDINDAPGGGNRASNEAQEEYRQNQAKDAAKAGMVVGGSRQRQERREANSQQEAAASANQSAYSSCMMGRGYTAQ